MCFISLIFPAFSNSSWEVAARAGRRGANGVSITGGSPRKPGQGVAQYPATQLFVLSEYIPSRRRFPQASRHGAAITRNISSSAGSIPSTDVEGITNTAFVIGPEGEVIFKQAKSVPIQFFSDGLPAPEQKVWDSPWGKIGICICYDLSYTRVTDPLIRLGARALIVPTMDVERWGRTLEARTACASCAGACGGIPGVPIFRVASSGISQLVAANGLEIAQKMHPSGRAVQSLPARWKFERCYSSSHRSHARPVLRRGHRGIHPLAAACMALAEAFAQTRQPAQIIEL